MAISILLSSPPERLAFTSLLTYSLAHRPTAERYSHTPATVIFLSPEASIIRSLTVSPLNLTGCWNAKLIPALALSVIDIRVISCPSSRILPDVGLIIPAISFASVDLPPPLGPVIAVKASSILRLIFLIISLEAPLPSDVSFSVTLYDTFCNSSILFLFSVSRRRFVKSAVPAGLSLLSLQHSYYYLTKMAACKYIIRIRPYFNIKLQYMKEYFIFLSQQISPLRAF